MSKNQKTKFKFMCPIFQVEVFLILGDKKQLIDFVDGYDNKGEYYNAECMMVVNDGGTDNFIVWVQDKIDYHAMVHEVVHLVKKIFKITNVPFDSDNDEIIAYYQNYWVRKFWNKMSKFIKD